MRESLDRIFSFSDHQAGFFRVEFGDDNKTLEISRNFIERRDRDYILYAIYPGGPGLDREHVDMILRRQLSSARTCQKSLHFFYHLFEKANDDRSDEKMTSAVEALNLQTIVDSESISCQYAFLALLMRNRYKNHLSMNNLSQGVVFANEFLDSYSSRLTQLADSHGLTVPELLLLPYSMEGSRRVRQQVLSLQSLFRLATRFLEEN